MGNIDIGTIRENIRTETGGWFALPTFFGGMGRVIDLFGTGDRYCTFPTAEEADADSIRRDIEAVGRDLRAAMASK